MPTLGGERLEYYARVQVVGARASFHGHVRDLYIAVGGATPPLPRPRLPQRRDETLDGMLDRCRHREESAHAPWAQGLSSCGGYRVGPHPVDVAHVRANFRCKQLTLLDIGR